MNQFMEMAFKEAREGMNKNHGGPFGCIIVQNGTVVARSHNRVLETNDPTAHAEILAIREASATLKSFDLSDCEIYSTSQPCPMCYSAIYWARIKKMYFGTTKDDVSAIGFDDSLIYDVIRGNADVQQLDAIIIDRDECQDLLNEWIAKPDKKMY